MAGRVRVCAAFPNAELGQPLSQDVLRADFAARLPGYNQIQL
jgi:hypothetical protein